LGIIGGIILIALGFYSFMKKKSYRQKSFVKNPKSVIRALVKGFVMNTVSPFVLIFWLGVMGFATVDLGFHDVDLKIFFGTILLSVLVTDVTKAYMANKLGLLIKPRIIEIMNIVVGVILLGFGIRLLYYAWTL
jgi:threonine/homoserine/homoserine lactone efflux protein